MDWTGLCIVGAFVGVLWLVGYDLHKKCSLSSPEAIRLPRIVGILFGRFQSEDVVSIRGIAAQLWACISWPVIGLQVMGIVSREQAVAWFGWSSAIPALLVLVVILRKRKRK